MTEFPEPGARALTLSDVPDSLLAEYGFHRGGAPAVSYTCSEPAAVLVPIGEVSGPDGRKLNEESVRSLLRGIRDGAELPPIVVCRLARLGLSWSTVCTACTYRPRSDSR
jgi:hypothetical protein